MINPPIYGLTGNMGCGKSTVAKFLDKFEDVIIFDTDQVAKRLLCEERHSQELKELLGSSVFSENKIDVNKVARLVFDNHELLQKLEKFIHPLVWQYICEETKKCIGVSFFVVEAALIYEAKWQNHFRAIIVVTCDKVQQYHRLYKYRNLTDAEIDKRIKRQLLNKEKVKLADFIIDTTCSMEEVEKKVNHLYHCLKGGVWK